MTTEQILLILNLLIGTVLPLLVALVTQYTTNPTVKGVLLATLSVLTSLIASIVAYLTAGHAVPWFDVIVNAFGAWVTAVAAHFGLWKRTAFRRRLQAIGSH